MPYYFFGNLDTSNIFSNYSDVFSKKNKKSRLNMFLVHLDDYNLCL